jgi:hypothetical protein
LKPRLYKQNPISEGLKSGRFKLRLALFDSVRRGGLCFFRCGFNRRLDMRKNMKFLDLTVALLILLISACPLLADSTNPIAQNLEVDEPFCYMKTADGKIVDLGRLCEKPPASETSQTCITGANMAAKVSIAQANYDGIFLSGQVINQGCKTIKNIKVNYEVLDELGNLIDNGFIYTQPVTLAPGQSAAFRGAVVAGAKVQATHADAQE